MAKKENATETTFVPEVGNAGSGEFAPEGDIGVGTDFDLSAEFKPFPLVPNGTYHGAVTDVKFDSERQAINWQVTLNENGGLCNDGETPIDGTQHTYSNWLPLIGDENTPDKSGRGNKRQAKINMLKQFADNMKVNMNSGAIISKAIIEKEWIGLAVDVKIKISEFQDAVTKVGTGRFRNDIDRMVQRIS
jgi:hypothetical protein